MAAMLFARGSASAEWRSPLGLDGDHSVRYLGAAELHEARLCEDSRSLPQALHCRSRSGGWDLVELSCSAVAAGFRKTDAAMTASSRNPEGLMAAEC